jgi:hypothetical protein
MGMALVMMGFAALHAPGAVARPEARPTPRPPQTSGTLVVALIAFEDLGLPASELLGPCSAPQKPIGPASWCAQPVSRHYGDYSQFEGWAIVDYGSQSETVVLLVSPNNGRDAGLWTEVGHADTRDYDGFPFGGNWANLADLQQALGQYYGGGYQYGGDCRTAAIAAWCDSLPAFSTDAKSLVWSFGLARTDAVVTTLISLDREGWRVYLVATAQE